MNELIKTKTQVPATQTDPYTSYGRAVGTDTPFLKFVKGVFQYGVDDEVLPLGKHLVPHMAELKAGFIRWENGAPADEATVRIAEGKPIPQREDLGDDDRNVWETDPNGTPQDPWKVVNTLPMKDPETGQQAILRCDLASEVYTGERLDEAPDMLVGFKILDTPSPPEGAGSIL